MALFFFNWNQLIATASWAMAVLFRDIQNNNVVFCLGKNQLFLGALFFALLACLHFLQNLQDIFRDALLTLPSTSTPLIFLSSQNSATAVPDFLHSLIMDCHWGMRTLVRISNEFSDIKHLIFEVFPKREDIRQNFKLLVFLLHESGLAGIRPNF